MAENDIEALAVEQVDRDAANAVRQQQLGFAVGMQDGHYLVQAFASHRLTALRSTTAEPVGYLVACNGEIEFSNYRLTEHDKAAGWTEHACYTHPTDSAAKDAALRACMNFAADERDRVIKLSEACERFLPKNICLSNSNVPDDLIIPLDVTMGELRKLAAALANRGEAGA